MLKQVFKRSKQKSSPNTKPKHKSKKSKSKNSTPSNSQLSLTEMELPITLPNGQAVGVLFKTFENARDVINNIMSSIPEEERKRFQLIEIKKSRDGILIERPLKDATIISEVKKEWGTDPDYQYSLKLSKLDHEIVVNFNLYFRMTAGVSQTKEVFYVNEYTTVGFLSDQVKTLLKINPNDSRFGLMGSTGGEKGLRKLSKEEKVLGLKTAWETPEKTFFQFQVLPEMEDQKHLGSDKESYLELYSLFPPTWKKRWASLRGTSIFFFKEKGESEHILGILEVDKAKINEIGQPKMKGLGQKFPYRFDIISGTETHSLAAEDQTSMTSWIEAIKSSASRRDARSINVNGPQMKRTLIAIGSTPPPSSALEEKKDVVPEMTIDEHLDEVKKKCDELMSKKGQELLPVTKAIVVTSQNICNMANKMISEKKSTSSKEKADKNVETIREKLRALIPAAKAYVANNGDEASAEFKELKKITKIIIEACETLVFLSRLDEEYEAAQPKPTTLQYSKTGNDELDKIMSGLASFGLAPELADMMKEAANFEVPEELPESNMNVPVQLHDDGLDSILSNLNSALEDFDVPGLKKPANDKFDNWMSTGEELRCSLCFDGISGRVVKGLNKNWHPHCYYCSQCGTNLESHPSSDVFEGPGGSPYCKKDFLKLCPVCPLCIKPILPVERFPAFNKIFHKSCFNCHDCKNPIAGGFELEDKPFCEMCYHTRQGTLCLECGKPIYGNAITAVGKKRHPHCFVCSFCKKQLTKETTRAKDEKIFCTSCYAKLF